MNAKLKELQGSTNFFNWLLHIRAENKGNYSVGNFNTKHYEKVKEAKNDINKGH